MIIFAIFWKFLSFFEFFQLQGPGNVLCGLTIEHCMICINNGLVFNILMSRKLAFFNIKLAFFSRFPKIFVNF